MQNHKSYARVLGMGAMSLHRQMDRAGTTYIVLDITEVCCYNSSIVPST